MADMCTQDTVMQDTVIQDTIIQDTVVQDTVVQDTIVPGVVRKIAKMKTTVREDIWRGGEKSHLLYLYTISNIWRGEDGKLNSRKGTIDRIVRGMTVESAKHHPGGALHASDPWYPRPYSYDAIYHKVRQWLTEEDDLAVELEAELDAHYGFVPDPAAQQRSQDMIARQKRELEQRSRAAEKRKVKYLEEKREKDSQKDLPRKTKTRDAQRMRRAKQAQDAQHMQRAKQVQDTNQAVRLAFQKIRMSVVINSTDA